MGPLRAQVYLASFGASLIVSKIYGQSGKGEKYLTEQIYNLILFL